MNKYRNKPVWECQECDMVYYKRPHFKKPGRKKHPTICDHCGAANVWGFGSKREFERFCFLRTQEKMGQPHNIKNLRRQVDFDLTVNGEHITTYRADMTYDERIEEKPHVWKWCAVVEDSKGQKSGAAYELFKVKKALMRAVHGVEIKET